MKKIFSIIYFLIVLNIFGKSEISDYRSYLLGDTNGNIYYQENMDVKYPLASVTKVMSIMVTLDEVRKGNIGLYDEVPIDWEAVSAGGSAIPLKSGEKVVLIDLIKSAAIKSANNATYAMAKYAGGGSINRFVKMMNEKAEKLGIGNEVEFYTPAGLPSYMTKKKMDMGTARAIYVMSMEALKYPEYLEIASQKRAWIKNGEYQLKSTILLLDQEGIHGLKTGYHNLARFNITVLSDKNETDIITVVMGGKTQEIRDNKVLELNNRFHDEYEKKEIIKKNKEVTTVAVKDGVVESVKLYGEDDFSLIVKKGTEINIELEKLKEVKAPVLKNTVMGEYDIIVNNKKVYSGQLKTHKEIAKKDLKTKIKEIFL